MKKLLPVAAAAALFATQAVAQTTAPEPTPTPSITSPSTSIAPPSTAGSLVLSDAEVRAWVNKVVYSSDGKTLGEVANFARDPSGRVTELQADVGGFLGIWETRVRIMPSQFKLDRDRVTLSMTADQSKTLPKIVKN